MGKASRRTNSFIFNRDNKGVFAEIVQADNEESPDFRKGVKGAAIKNRQQNSARKRANSVGKSSGKQPKSDIDIDLISNMAESVLRERNRTKSIFVNPRG